MRRLILAIAALAPAVAVLPSTLSTATSSTGATDRASVLERASRPGQERGFERFLHRYEAANTAFVNGDPARWLAMTAELDPASIFGGFGGMGEAGVADVHARYLLAATAFRPSGARVEFDYLVKDVRGRLAYTVAIERAQVRYAGQSGLKPHLLRVTMIFRHERGGWRIAHRHADTMTTLQLPS